MHKEMEVVKDVQRSRVQKYREELVEDMRQHEVYLLERPTTAELEDKKLQHIQSLRRRHHKVVVGADEKEIRNMPNHKLCIAEDLKRSLSKMRENLFQRKLNLAIYEKTVGDWAYPQIYAEVRRKNRQTAASQGNTASQWLASTADEKDGGSSPRQCAGGCGFQATWHSKYCCQSCASSGSHGKRCERKPMPAEDPLAVATAADVSADMGGTIKDGAGLLAIGALTTNSTGEEFTADLRT